MTEHLGNITISICMIVRNEEAVLERCLNSVRGVYDQLVIVDTGSEDETVSIARRFTDEVFCEPWENDFGKARNSSFSHARSDYIIYLDADDVLPEEEKEKLLKLKTELSTLPEDERPRTILMSYDVPEAGGISFRQRMVARHDDRPYWHGAIHECMDYEKPVMTTDIMFLHRKLVQPPKDRNCNIIRAIPREELKNNFWLSAQCNLDMLLAGHEEEAEEYFNMCEDEAGSNISVVAGSGVGTNPDTTCDTGDDRYTGYPYMDICLQLASTLNHHKLWEGTFRWVKLSERIWSDHSGAVYDNSVLLMLYQQGVKALTGLGRLEEAVLYNEKVLELAPDNRAALMNRAYFAKKLKS